MMYRLWADDEVSGEWDGRVLRRVRMLPRPQPRPRVLVGGYVDRVLKRAATLADGWITYFYTAGSFARSWGKIRAFAEEAGRDPAELHNAAQLPLCIGSSYESAAAAAREYVGEYFDTPAWSEATADSAIAGTPEQCAEQIAAHIEAGAQHLIFCPRGYDTEQVHRLAGEVLPLLGARLPGAAAL
jgi:alkanesulfonate monooxygenase